MKKTLAVVALLATALTMATAKGAPVLFAHGFIGDTALGGTFDYNTDRKLEFDKSLDFGGGIAINFAVASLFGISVGADVCYNQVGFTSPTGISIFGSTVTTDTAYSYNYLSIDIPLMITARAKKFNFAFGPTFSLPIGEVKGQYWAVNSTDKSDVTAKTIASPFIFGLKFAAGYEQRMGMLRGVVGLNYQLDLMPLTVKSGDDTVNFATRRALNVDVGVKLPLKF